MARKQKAIPLQTNGIKLWGEVISWSIKNGVVKLTDLDNAIQQAGLDAGLRKDMEARNAFSRACSEMKENRIIRTVKDDKNGDWIEFQFTKEELVADEFLYNTEAKLELNKKTGQVICTNGALKMKAESLIQFHTQHRKTADVTRLVQAFFEKEADLFPIRDQGGVYFVPIQHAEFLNKIEILLSAVGGVLKRFPVPEGVGKGDASVRQSVKDGIEEMIKQYELRMEAFEESTRNGTIEKLHNELQEAQYKIEGYAVYLDHQKAAVEQRLSEAKEKLKKKIKEMGRVRDEEEE